MPTHVDPNDSKYVDAANPLHVTIAEAGKAAADGAAKTAPASP